MSVVQKGDWIYLRLMVGKDTTIEWKKYWVKRSKVFKVIPFLNFRKTNKKSSYLQNKSRI